jgi:CO dehydrogenase maturation factor
LRREIEMKLAIAGKGGAGKTTLAAALSRWLADRGRAVVAVDADPDGNLASAFGIPQDGLPRPIAQMRDLILERTGAQEGGAGLMFRLNPQVHDLPERFAVSVAGVRLLVLGTVESGGKGCMCPESSLLKALLQHLLLRLSDDVILDMEAGLEHMGRASARGVDAMIAVIEPGMRSIQTATRIQQLACDIGISRTLVVANKIREARQRALLERALGGSPILAALPYCPALARADLEGRAASTEGSDFAEAIHALGADLERQFGSPPCATTP